MPIAKTKLWLNKEKDLGCLNPDRAILATATKDAIPHSRVVAIREISEKGLLFFTQRGTRKCIELMENPKASITFWFELQQRQIIIEGTVTFLPIEANHHFWETMPRDRQLRFSAYAPFSGQEISSIDQLENEYTKLSNQFIHQKEIPMSDYYCGLMLVSETFYFYTIRTETFSEVLKYEYDGSAWTEKMLSP